MAAKWVVNIVPFDANAKFGNAVHFCESAEEANDLAQWLIVNIEGVDVFIAKLERKMYQVRSDRRQIVTKNY